LIKIVYWVISITGGEMSTETTLPNKSYKKIRQYEVSSNKQKMLAYRVMTRQLYDKYEHEKRTRSLGTLQKQPPNNMVLSTLSASIGMVPYLER